jgi:hypothetical protein
MGGWRRGSALAFGLAAAMGLSAGCSSNSNSGPNNPPPPHYVAPDGGSVQHQPDAGSDGGTTVVTPPDAGTDGGTDAGIAFGTQGPWPVANTIYTSANGINANGEGGVVGTTTDESENLWVATSNALYLLKPGETTFHRFTSAEGLHNADNAMEYCNDSGDSDASPLYPGWVCKDPSGGTQPGVGGPILSIVGGGPNEVLVGYQGNHDWSSPLDGTYQDPYRHSGMVDRVRLNADGTISVLRIDLDATNDWHYWHDRDIEKIVYDHFVHPHVAYVGTNHGVTLLMPDRARYPNLANGSVPAEYWHTVEQEYMADHLHAHVCTTPGGCGDGEQGQAMGEWRALSIDKNGDLWTGGRWTGGKITWDPAIDPNGTKDVTDWSLRHLPTTPPQTFAPAFGDPYPGGSNYCGQPNPPVFMVGKEGDFVSLLAVTEATDGTVWFASGAWWPDDVELGLAAYKGDCFTYHQPSEAGLSSQNISDMVALPDGRLAISTHSDGVSLWNPTTGAHTMLTSGNGYLPDNSVEHLELDTMVNPPALHVSTASGSAVIRVLPN